MKNMRKNTSEKASKLGMSTHIEYTDLK